MDKTYLVTRETRQLPEDREIHRLARVSAERSGAIYMRLFWWLMTYIGFRVGELSAPTVNDVHHDERVRIDVTKNVRKDGTIEPYVKGYKHRTVIVPSLLDRSVLARVEEVRCGGGSLLFPSWTAGPHDPTLHSTLNDPCAAGAGIGWRVRATQLAALYTAADRRTRTYRAKPSSIEYTIHDLRAFAATAMYDHGGAGIKIRRMNMSLQAVARQLGDTPETVKANYLGIIEGNAALLEREVPSARNSSRPTITHP